jgi:O-antigen ligase
VCRAEPDEPAAEAPPTRAAARDWAYVGLLAFTALLFFRPQDLIIPLRMLHVAEIAAVFALGSLVFGRLGRGLPVTRVTPELAGVLAFAAVILITAPFGVWMGGSIGTFTELYAKVVLIFVLMVNTLDSPKRVEGLTWLIVVASGYIAGRTVFDYVRGVNLIEHGRVQGAVGGMFKNPNDLALNMVAVLPLAVLLVVRPVSLVRRCTAAGCVALMLAAIVASQSRSGTVGLAVMALILAAHLVRRKPGLVLGAAFAAVLALPLVPSSYWTRLASITDERLDQTGSREARSILLKESFQAFVQHPLTGVGAGQFKNYNPEERQEAWRESHNVVLQVGAELGIFGLIVFGFLVARAMYAPIQTRRLLRRLARLPRGQSGGSHERLSPAEYEMLTMHSAALTAALAGWFVCALFASVAYHWTFYYLLALAVAPRDYLAGRFVPRIARRRMSAAAAVAAGARA